MKTLDLKKEVNIAGVADNKGNYFKQHGQQFFYSPSGLLLHLVEKLPCGDYYFCKSWRLSSILMQFQLLLNLKYLEFPLVYS